MSQRPQNGRRRFHCCRVRERDPNWRATPGLAQDAEGAIRASEDMARQAEARFAELQRAGIGPGRFAAESIPARGPARDFTADERREINRLGREYGCHNHTCGTPETGTSPGPSASERMEPIWERPTPISALLVLQPPARRLDH